jgi:hypothetical protein
MGKRHDEKYQLVERRYEAFGIHLPNQSGQQGFSYQIIFQQDVETLEIFETLQTCGLTNKFM